MEEELEEEVDPQIVLAFAALGILFDLLSLWSYKAWHAPASIERRGEPSSQANLQQQQIHNINMLSALLHVFSDLARSTTTFVEGLFLLSAPGADSVAIDGWSALIVCSLIMIGVLSGVARWAGELWAYISREWRRRNRILLL